MATSHLWVVAQMAAHCVHFGDGATEQGGTHAGHMTLEGGSGEVGWERIRTRGHETLWVALGLPLGLS
jgi:hypothetical protein